MSNYGHTKHTKNVSACYGVKESNNAAEDDHKYLDEGVNDEEITIPNHRKCRSG